MESCAVKDQCELIFKADWLEECNQLIDPFSYIETCKIDYCIDTSDETRNNLLGQFYNDA